MNELFVLLDTMAQFGWVYACTSIVLAAGFLIFDRPAKPRAGVEDALPPELRRAA